MKNTIELWHGTAIPHDTGYIEPVSFCLGNAVEAPAKVSYYWRTWKEAAEWSVYQTLTIFQEMIEDDGHTNGLYESIGIVDIPDGTTPDMFELKGFVWDSVKRKIIIIDDEYNRTSYRNIQIYFDRYKPLSLQYQVVVDRKKVGKGQTATMNEFVVNEPVKITKVNVQEVYSGTLDTCVEWVSDDYYYAVNARRFASLFNRGLSSFLFTNELVYNTAMNEDKFVAMRRECRRGDNAFIKKYIKDNGIEHLYPLKRIKLYILGKRKLKAIEKV